MPLPSMYTEFASWFHLLSDPTDYEEEATRYLAMLREARGRDIASLLELGSGGGNNASWYGRTVPHITLTDLSPDMLALSRTINPTAEHIVGDMRAFRLGRTFDAVFVHDAIGYLTTEGDLLAAFQTAAQHLASGGAALFVPDATRETFHSSTDHGGHDSTDGERGLRYLEWSRDPDPSDTTCQTDYAYLLREGGRVWAAEDHHIEGLFPEATWRRLLIEAGFDVLSSEQVDWGEGQDSQVAFLARRT